MTLKEKARDMRHAIDMIEGALMRWPELMDLPDKLGQPRHRRELGLYIKGNCGQLYDLYDAMSECNRIINSPEYNFAVALTNSTASCVNESEHEKFARKA